jgi:CDGSH-type Zn-finger protein
MENEKEKNLRVKVEVVENGPLRITGKFIMKDLKRDKEETTDFIELCRCGRSRNKPYCDHSHEKPE